MSQMIHYRDDLFLLSVQVRALDTALSLEADAEFWHERIFSDILFIDTMSRNLAGLLARNLHLLDRDEYLRLLERVSLDFAETLERLLSGQSALTAALGAGSAQIRSIAAAQRDLAEDLGESLVGRDPSASADSSIVSGDELAKLLE